MYELIILSLLMRFPLHGYLIARIANDTIGPWAKISNGTLYPLLTRLERAGLITRASNEEDSGQGEQNARTFAITDEGRKRFHQVMMDTSSNIGDYQRIFHLKVPFLDLLQTRERLLLLNHYLNYCQMCILHINTEAENLRYELGDDSAAPLFRELALQSMHHRAWQWQAEVDWALQLRDMLAPQAEKA